MKHKKKISLLLGVVMLFMLFSACGGNSTAGKGFRFSLDSSPKQFDPQYASSDSEITVISSMFEGLASVDENGKIVEGCASWSISDDGLVYTFDIKKTMWSDVGTKDEDGNELPGTQVTAHDFVFGIKRALSRDMLSPLAHKLFDIKGAYDYSKGYANEDALGVAAINDFKLEITLEKPTEDFLIKTLSPPFMPCNEAFFESTGGRYGMGEKYILTNGPFYLRTWTPDESVLLRKHTGYYGADGILPYAVRFVINPHYDNPLAAIDEGEIDVLPLTYDQIENVDDTKHKLVSLDDTVLFLAINNGDSFFKNENIRAALRDSIDWDSLGGVLHSEIYAPSTGFVTSESLMSSSEKYRTNQNGISKKIDAVSAKESFQNGLAELGLAEPPKVSLLYYDDEYSLAVARMILQFWQKNLSFYCSLEAVDRSKMNSRVMSEDYALALFDYTAKSPYASDMFAQFVSSSEGNFAGFSNAEYDRLFEEAAKNDFPRSKTEQLESFLWDHCAAIPVAFDKRVMAQSASISGLVIHPFGGGVYGSPYDFRKAGKTN